MAFSRSKGQWQRPTTVEFTAQMAGIGMNFAATPQTTADVETTLVHAAEIGMDEGDLRILSVLTTWIGVHYPYVNADKLIRLVSGHPSERVKAYWSAIAKWLARDRRFTRLEIAYRSPPVDLLSAGMEFHLARRGEDPRFVGSSLRVPAETLRDRGDDVLAPEVLAKRHAGYRNRVLHGPTWRADVFTVLSREPTLSVAEAARRASCSFATAWQAARDFRLLQRSA